MTDDRATVADGCRILYESGLTELFTGHVSARQDGTMLIPEHRHDQGRGLESIAPEYVIEVEYDGAVVADGDGATTFDEEIDPPSEFPIHSQILNARPDVHSVAHAHPVHATALSAAGVPILPATLDATLFGEDVPIFDPGPVLIHGEAPAAELADTLGDGSALLVRGHGAVTVGRSVAGSVARMYLLERAARLQAIAGAVGGVKPFADLEAQPGYLAEEEEAFFEDVFAFLRREYLADADCGK